MNQQKILWGANFFSTIIYVLMAYFIAPIAKRPFEESLRDPIVLAIYGAAIASFVAGLVIPSRLANAPSQKKMLMATALFDSCSIFGLVNAFLHQDWRLTIPTWIVSLIGFIRVWPGGDVNQDERAANRG